MTCAYAVRGAFLKIRGVESVDVSLSKGVAAVKLKPGNRARPQEFWKTVRKNGFTPKATQVVVRGEFLGESSFRVSGTNEIFDVRGSQGQAGKTVNVDGVLTPGKDLNAPVPLEIPGIRTSQ